MTEPVAYLNKYVDSSTNITRFKPENQRLLSSNPLYTSEQLHPRVKMTQAEFDEFNRLAGDNVYYALYKVANREEVYPSLYKRLFKIDRVESNIAQTEFAGLWSDYDQDNPEETIEIVPEMKWFVQKKSFDGNYKFLKTDRKDLSFNHTKDNATYFDTKEEAELWTNPLTEAVQLPVEGGNDI